MHERHDHSVRLAEAGAAFEAQRRRDSHVGSLDLLFGLVHDTIGLAPEINGLLDRPRIATDLSERPPENDGPPPDRLGVSMEFGKAFQRAYELADDHGHWLIQPEHLLLGLIARDRAEASALLGRCDVDLGGLRQALERHLAGRPSEDPPPDASAEALAYWDTPGRPAPAELCGTNPELDASEIDPVCSSG